MTESDFIKAIELLFPKGNPLREFADYVSKEESIDKLTQPLFPSPPGRGAAQHIISDLITEYPAVPGRMGNHSL